MYEVQSSEHYRHRHQNFLSSEIRRYPLFHRKQFTQSRCTHLKIWTMKRTTENVQRPWTARVLISPGSVSS
jgi:hypothetical protein